MTLNCIDMKKILALCAFAALMMSSCVTPIKFQQNAGFIDYSMFPGMFLTESNSVSFDYQPIGSLYAEETSGEYQVVKKKVGNNEIYGDAYAVVDGKYRHANPQSALTFAAEKAKEMGGNGIINLRIEKIEGGYCVTGMVIKRK